MTHERGEIAIIGAGPVGIEAALAAAEAGMPFTVYEAGAGVGSSIRDWGHVQLFTPWSMNVSERARRFLTGSGDGPLDPGVCPTGDEVVEVVLQPLAASAALAPNIRCGVTVAQVGREGRVKNDEIGTPARGHTPFRLLLRDASGRESVAHADVVLDCTGSSAIPNALGSGGVPAPGEAAACDFIERKIPDLRDASSLATLAGKRVLLAGAGHSAQTVARDLAELVRGEPDTRVTWLIRSQQPDFAPLPGDPLAARSELMETARRLAFDARSPLQVKTGTAVQAVEPSESGIRVTLGDVERGDVERLEVDRILAMVGAVGDRTLYAQLQVHECWATQGPMKLAAALLSSSSDDCLTQEVHGADTLRNPEPGFFILGSKSYGRNTTFLLRVGYEQVDEVFSLITKRPVVGSGAA